MYFYLHSEYQTDRGADTNDMCGSGLYKSVKNYSRTEFIYCYYAYKLLFQILLTNIITNIITKS